MAWREGLDGIGLAHAHEGFGFGSETIVTICVLSHEYWSDSNWVTSYYCLSCLFIVDDECEDSIELVDELFNAAELLIEVDDDLTVAARLELEAVFLLELPKVVNLSVANDGDFIFLQRLISSL